MNMINRDSPERSRDGGSIAVAIDRDKASRMALKWVLHNVVSRDQTVRLIHVIPRPPSAPPIPNPADRSRPLSELRHLDAPTTEMLLPFRCFCMRRQVHCEVVVLEDLDVAKAIAEFISYHAVEDLFLGAATKSLTRLFKNDDIPSSLMKMAPDFCNVYVIGKGKITNSRKASRPVPAALAEAAARLEDTVHRRVLSLRRGTLTERPYDEITAIETDRISWTESGRLSTDSNFLSFYENLGSPLPEESYMLSNFEESDFDQDLVVTKRQVDLDDLYDESPVVPAAAPDDGEKVLQASNVESSDEDTRRLMVELQRTMDMYHEACKEAIVAKQMVLGLRKSKIEAERKLQDAQLAVGAATSIMEKEMVRCRAALKEAEAARLLADQELQKRLDAEERAHKEAEEKRNIMMGSGHSDMYLEYKSLFHISVAVMSVYLYFYCR